MHEVANTLQGAGLWPELSHSVCVRSVSADSSADLNPQRLSSVTPAAGKICAAPGGGGVNK